VAIYPRDIIHITNILLSAKPLLSSPDQRVGPSRPSPVRPTKSSKSKRKRPIQRLTCQDVLSYVIPKHFTCVHKPAPCPICELACSGVAGLNPLHAQHRLDAGTWKGNVKPRGPKTTLPYGKTGLSRPCQHGRVSPHHQLAGRQTWHLSHFVACQSWKRWKIMGGQKWDKNREEWRMRGGGRRDRMKVKTE
jgi:hypothetical protein